MADRAADAAQMADELLSLPILRVTDENLRLAQSPQEHMAAHGFPPSSCAIGPVSERETP